MLCAVCDVYLFEGHGAKSMLVRDKGHVHPACESRRQPSQTTDITNSRRTKTALPCGTISAPQPHNSVPLHMLRWLLIERHDVEDGGERGRA